LTREAGRLREEENPGEMVQSFDREKRARGVGTKICAHVVMVAGQKNRQHEPKKQA